MDFISLPILILEEIIQNLSASELKILRTTSCALNSVVNQPKYLKRIKTHIKNEEELEDILANCKLDIYSVIFDHREPSNFGNKIQLVEKYKSTLIHLELKVLKFEFDFIEILKEANHLKSLSLSYCRHPNQIILNEITQLNLTNLKIFKIESRHANVQDFIEIFLQKCPHLDYIRLPIWQLVYHGALQETKLIQPLLNFIANRSNPLTIDFGGFGQTWGGFGTRMYKRYELNKSIFPITPTILLQICRQPGSTSNKGVLKLRNVPLSSLPEKSKLTPDQMSNLNACIESILMVGSTHQNYSQKYLPPKAEIVVGIGRLEEELELEQQGPNLNITSIHWDLSLNPTIDERLFGTNPTNELIEKSVANCLPINIHDKLCSDDFKLDIWSRFPNLKVIQFGGNTLRSYMRLIAAKEKARSAELCGAIIDV